LSDEGEIISAYPIYFRRKWAKLYCGAMALWAYIYH